MSETLTTAFTTALTTVQTDVSGMYEIALPVALAIMTIPFALKLGIRFFKSIAS